jgi:hypothetical protein
MEPPSVTVQVWDAAARDVQRRSEWWGSTDHSRGVWHVPHKSAETGKGFREWDRVLLKVTKRLHPPYQCQTTNIFQIVDDWRCSALCYANDVLLSH